MVPAKMQMIAVTATTNHRFVATSPRSIARQTAWKCHAANMVRRAPKAIIPTPAGTEEWVVGIAAPGFNCSASSLSHTPNLATTNPSVRMARLVRTHARNVRSAASSSDMLLSNRSVFTSCLRSTLHPRFQWHSPRSRSNATAGRNPIRVVHFFSVVSEFDPFRMNEC